MVNTLQGIKRKFGQATDTESEQILIRLIFGIVEIAYFSNVASYHNILLWDLLNIGQIIAVSHLLLGLIIFVWFLYAPRILPARRYAGILSDLSMLSIMLFLSGQDSVFLFTFYLWIILGNGFRYGLKYLLVSQGVGIAFFSLAITYGDYWQQDAMDIIAWSFILLLIVVPAYTAFLIKKLHLAANAAKLASEAKTKFLANMSHELRTPLHGVIGLNEILKRTDLNREQKEVVESINDSAGILLDLIEKVLDISKIETGKVKIRNAVIQLEELIHQIASSQRPIAEAKGLALRSHVSLNVPLTVIADDRALRQIIINLVGNAIKFTQTGRIDLSITGFQQTPEEALLKFSIVDTGTGITEEDQKHIFDNFTRASSGRDESIAGAGLGTTIAKELVEMMGGEIGFESQLGIGSTFWFTLPAKIACPEPLLPGIVLFTNAAMEMVYRHQFSEWGFHAVTLIEPSQFDRRVTDDISVDALIDYQSCSHDPDFKLLNAVTELRAAGRVKTITLFNVLSGKIPKWIQDKIDYSCGQLNNAREAGNAIRLASVESRKSLNYIARANMTPMTILVAEDNLVNQRVISGLLEKEGHRVIMTYNGEEALDVLVEKMEEIDLAIIDKNMPYMDGFELVKTARFMETSGRLKFIMMTADATPESYQKGREAGVDAFLTKPIAIDQFMSELERIGHNIARTPALNPDKSLPSASNTDIIVDTDRFEQLMTLDDGNGIIDQIIKDFKDDADRHLDSIFNTINDDYVGFINACHGFKGAANEVGARRIAQLCNDLQHIRPHELGSNQVIATCSLIKLAYRETLQEMTQRLASAG